MIENIKISVLAVIGIQVLAGIAGFDSQAAGETSAGEKLAFQGQFFNGRNKDSNCDFAVKDCTLETDNDISGAICIPDGRCFVVSDETRFIQQFSFSSDTVTAGQRYYLKKTKEKKERKGNSKELDLEALAADESGIVAVGSHSWRRNGCEAQKTRNALYYFSQDFEPGELRDPLQSQKISLNETILHFDQLAKYFDSPLQENGLNIEGAAILNDRFYVGFRAPYDEMNPQSGYILSLEMDGIVNGETNNARLHEVTFQLPGTGIRGMEQLGDGLLLLTGKAGANGSGKDNKCKESSEFQDNLAQVYYWDGENNTPKLVTTLLLPKEDWKAESLILEPDQIEGAKMISIIVFFDKAQNGSPYRYSIPRTKFLGLD